MSRKRGVHIGFAWSRSDGSGTVRAGESTRAGVAAATGSAAAVELATGLYSVRKMADGPRRARIHNLQRG